MSFLPPPPKYLLLLLVFLSVSSKLVAQSEYTAVREANFSTFITGSEVATGFGPTRPAYTAGFDLTRVYQSRHFLNVAFEGRAEIVFSNAYSEHAYLTGFKFDHRIRRVHLYGDSLIGFGSIGILHETGRAFHRDASYVPAFGGGVDFSLNSNWAIKGDYLWQRWRLDPRDPPFYPASTSVGLVYHWGLGGPR